MGDLGRSWGPALLPLLLLLVPAHCVEAQGYVICVVGPCFDASAVAWSCPLRRSSAAPATAKALLLLVPGHCVEAQLQQLSDLGWSWGPSWRPALLPLLLLVPAHCVEAQLQRPRDLAHCVEAQLWLQRLSDLGWSCCGSAWRLSCNS